MKCKDCEKYQPIATPGRGVCSMPASFFPTEAENDCCYIAKGVTCGDCARFSEDFACFTADENDDASDCGGFVDIEEERVMDALRVWLSRGVYSREKIMALCDEFEETEVYKFIQKALSQEMQDN